MTTVLPPIIKLLSHELRWRLVQSLAVGDYRVNELVGLLGQPLNLVSYHLKLLREGEMVTVRRSEADGRDTYYSLDLDKLRASFGSAGRAIHPSLVTAFETRQGTRPNTRVLFVCTHNSARSQMAEGLMRHVSGGHVDVYSAGSEPGTVHPNAIRTMDALGIDIRAQRSEGFDAFADQHFDVVITVCDRAREVCPSFPGGGEHIHWGFPDPASIADADERQRVFDKTAQRLRSRIQHFLIHLSEESDS